MSVIINPGSGPVKGARREHADVAIASFMEDLDLEVVSSTFEREEDDGRFTYTLNAGERRIEVEMPGLPLERVRYVDSEEQNIWDFPRLYVDGSSWVWKFGVDVARRSLLGEDEEE